MMLKIAIGDVWIRKYDNVPFRRVPATPEYQIWFQGYGRCSIPFRITRDRLRKYFTKKEEK
jgi:hypothetical protein